MPIATILACVVQYGPSVLPVIQELVALIEGGKTSVTSADIATLVALGKKSSSDYLAAAGGAPAVPKV